MLKFKKIFLMILPAAVLMLFAGIIFAASSAPTQTTQVTAYFDAPSGIRWNPGMDSFEVFNAAGVSYIASGKYVSVTGNVAETQTDASYALADANKIYYIMQDISYSDESDAFNPAWRAAQVSIGASGVIDGRGFYLRGFPLRQVAGNKSTALFYNNSGIIRNLNMADFICTDASDGALLCFNNGGIIKNCAAYAAGVLDASKVGEFTVFVFENMDNGVISDCVNNVSVSGDWALSGIAANTYGIIRNCVNNGNLTSRSEIGGIAYDVFNSTVQNCINNGSLTCSENAGGIANYVEEGLILNCRNNGNIACQNGSMSYAGGIVSSMENGTINDCVNTGQVTSAANAAGIVCYTYGNSVTGVSGSVKDCNNSGNITAYMFLGGIAGYGCEYFKEVINCVNSGDVSNISMSAGVSKYTGGIIGYSKNQTLKLRGCANGGEVKNSVAGGNYTGGIIGSYDGGLISDCANKGKVSGYSYVGGILGYAQGAGTKEITSSTNNGDINNSDTGNGSYAGGILAYSGFSTLKVQSCINNGTLTADTGTSYSGGIAGYINSPGTFIGCTNNGNIGGRYAAGLLGYVYSVTVSYTVVDNINNGNISGRTATYGIMGSASAISDTYMTKRDNVNYGTLSGGTVYQLFR